MAFQTSLFQIHMDSYSTETVMEGTVNRTLGFNYSSELENK